MEKFMAYLDEQTVRLRQESSHLAADNRRDEGDLAKIRANVYEICKSVIQVLERGKAKAKLTELHSTWSRNLDAARVHGDVKKAVIEEIKLETLAEIQEKLEGV